MSPVSAPFALSVLWFASATAGPVAAQIDSRNVELLSNVLPANTGLVSDVWGYFEAATGREYAILLSENGVYIYNATDPRNPYLTAQFASSDFGWSNAWWKDAQHYQDHLYIVSEGGPGVAIVDLSDPENPAYVHTWHDPPFGTAHNLAIDPDTGLLGICDTTLGTVFLDLQQSLTRPPLVGRQTGDPIHDLEIRRGLVHFASISRHWYIISDLTRLPRMNELSRISIPRAHNAWPTRDDQYVCLTSESVGPGMTVLDIRDPRAPAVVAQWTLGGIIHNAQLDDRLVHVSYYVSGYRLVDLSDPQNPLEVGYLDTSTFPDGFNGHWGVYGLQPSGVVYSGDVQNGLYIHKPLAAAERYGAGTAGTGPPPTIHTFGSAYLGNRNFKLEVEGAEPGLAFLLLGRLRSDLDVFGLKVLVAHLDARTATLSAIVDAEGRAELPLPLPVAPTLDGYTMNAQAFVLDPNGPLGLAATAGVTFTPFTP